MSNFTSGNTGAFSWFFQRISGIILVILLLFHFGIMHYIGSGETTYKTVMQRLANPLFKTLDITFLLLALYHGFNGLITIINDYISSDKWRLFLFSKLSIVGLCLFVLGIITILKF